ncbi:hypothetical protein AgCh_030241 [Apium graveolens]
MVSSLAGSDFSFDNRNNFLYDSAPESPRGFNNYFSAPTSPSNQISFSFIPDEHLKYDHHHGFDKKHDDHKPFMFIPGDYSNHILVSSADELIDGGMIKPCEPKHKKIIQSRMSFSRSNKICSEHFPVRQENKDDTSSSWSSSFGWLYKKLKLKDLLSRNASEGHETSKKYDALKKLKNSDLMNSSSSTNSVSSRNRKNKEGAMLSAHERHYKTRSQFGKPFVFIPGDRIDLIPVSSADELFDGGKIKPFEPQLQKIIQSSLSFGRSNKVHSEPFTTGKEHVKDSSSSSSLTFSWLHKKWKLKDLLFRNASEGHETNKKYDFLRKIKDDDSKNSSRNKKSKEKAPLSAHERHYRVNRAAAEELKRRTYLPYKQNLTIGCMNIDAAGAVREPSRSRTSSSSAR